MSSDAKRAHLMLHLMGMGMDCEDAAVISGAKCVWIDTPTVQPIASESEGCDVGRAP